MKTKICIWATSIIVGICIITLGIIFYQTCFVHIGSVESAESRYIRGDVNSVKQLTDEEIKVLREIFNNKLMMKDIPACPFSEDISIQFDNELTFWIGYDDCGTVYVKEKDMYIDLSDREKEYIFALMKQQYVYDIEDFESKAWYQ